MANISAADRDLLIRTVIGEAGNQPDEGQAAVANVVLNRAAAGTYGGSGVQDVIFAKNQFEPWMTRKNELMAIDTGSKTYQRAAANVDQVLLGVASDPTGGATHFLQPDIVRQRRGGTPPDWAQGAGQRIGDHVFYAPEGKVTPSSRPTISYDDMTVPQVTPTVSEAVAETQRADFRESTSPSLWQGVKDAANEGWIINNLLGDTPKGQAAVPDPNWRWNPEEFKTITKTIPREYWDVLSQATSQENSKWLKDRIDERVAAEKRLEDLGWTGTALRVGMSFLDPAALAVAAATEGAAGAVILPAKVGRAANTIGRSISGGLGGAAVVGAMDASDLRPHSTSEYLLGAGIGMGLGGLTGSLYRGLPPETAARITAVGERLKAEAGQGVDNAAGSVGAAKAPRTDLFLDDAGLSTLHDGDIPKTALNGIWRVDSSAVIDRKSGPIGRALGNALLEDGVGKQGGSITGHAAELEMRRFYQTDAAKLRAAEEMHFEDWAAAQNLNFIEKQTRYGEFTDSVGLYIRNPDNYPDAPESIKKMAKSVASFMGDRLEFQQNPLRDRGLEGRPIAGAQDVPRDSRYLPRVADPRKVRDLVDRFSGERIEQLIAGAIRSAQPELDEKVVANMAKGYLRRRMDQAYGLGDDPKLAFLSNDVDALRAVLRNEYDLADADIENVIAALPKRENAGGKDSHFKRRIDLDEGYETMMQPKYGGPAEPVKFTDLLVNDAMKLADIYNRRTAGRIALARVRIKDPEGSLLVDGITKDSEFDHLIKATKQQIADMTMNGKTGLDAEAAEKNLRFAYDMILGRQLPSQIGKFAEFSRYVRKYNFARLMNMMGFNQFQELSSIAGQTGMKAMMQRIPALGRIRDMDAGMIRKTALDRDLEALGLATEELRNRRLHRWDEYGADYQTGRTQAAQAANNTLEAAGKLTSTVSGFKYVNELSQMWAARAAAQAFADLSGNPTAANLRRMASLGLDGATLKNVLAQIKQHSSIEEGSLFGGKLTALNLDKWTDLDARVAFENALFRWSRRIIQENDYGSMAQWMSHPAAQLLLQFRTFQTHAWAKQFLHNVNMRDGRAFATFAYSMAAGAAVYTVQEQLKSAARKDRDAYLKKRLAPMKIAQAAFARAGFSSFMPTIMDTGLATVGQKPWFDARASGQPSDMWVGNPAIGGGNDILKAIQGTIGPTIDGRPRTREDTVNMIRPMLWQNALPVTILMNYLTRGMPDRPQRQQ